MHKEDLRDSQSVFVADSQTGGSCSRIIETCIEPKLTIPKDVRSQIHVSKIMRPDVSDHGTYRDEEVNRSLQVAVVLQLANLHRIVIVDIKGQLDVPHVALSN